MKMRKIYSLLIYCFVIVLLTACDTAGEVIDAGYMQLTYSVVYPEDTEANAYSVTFNGKDIGITYFSRDELNGKLQVYAKGSTIVELDTMITVKPSQKLQLIKLPGKSVTLYDEDSYITFSSTLSLFEGYTAVFNNQEIVDGKNYISKDDVSGDLLFYKKGESTPVYAIANLLLEAGESIIVLQSSDTEFLSLTGSSDGEEDPITRNLSKIRFFYSPTDALNVDSIRMDIYSYDANVSEINLVASVTIKKGELSSYVELDVAQYKESYNSPAGFAYSLYNAKTGEMIEDVMNGNNMFSFETQSDDQYKMKYKFQTQQITNSIGYPLKFVMGTEWNSASTE